MKILILIFILSVFCASAEAQTGAETLHTDGAAKTANFAPEVRSVSALLAAIQRRAEPLVYISEQESDVNAFIIGRNIRTLNAETFRAANPKLLFEPIEDFDKATFFARLERQDARWTRLRRFLETRLEQIRVFKAGDRRRDIYVVGLLDGHIVGVRTFAVET